MVKGKNGDAIEVESDEFGIKVKELQLELLFMVLTASEKHDGMIQLD